MKWLSYLTLTVVFKKSAQERLLSYMCYTTSQHSILGATGWVYLDRFILPHQPLPLIPLFLGAKQTCPSIPDDAGRQPSVSRSRLDQPCLVLSLGFRESFAQSQIHDVEKCFLQVVRAQPLRIIYFSIIFPESGFYSAITCQRAQSHNHPIIMPIFHSKSFP